MKSVIIYTHTVTEVSLSEKDRRENLSFTGEKNMLVTVLEAPFVYY